MERIRTITHLGQRILLIDCADCPADEILKVVDEVPKVVAQEPGKAVLLLADFSRAEISREAMERIKIAAVYNRAHLKRSAWVLTGNLPKSAHSTIEKFSIREIPIFATREDALKYLVGADQVNARGEDQKATGSL